MKIILALTLLLIPSTVLCQNVDKSERATHYLIAANVGAHFADVASTQWLMGHNAGSGLNTYKESNLLMKPFAKNPVTIAVTKGGFAAFQSYLFIKYHKKHKKIVIIGTVLSTTLTSIASYNNYKHYKEARDQ